MGSSGDSRGSEAQYYSMDTPKQITQEQGAGKNKSTALFDAELDNLREEVQGLTLSPTHPPASLHVPKWLFACISRLACNVELRAVQAQLSHSVLWFLFACHV